MTELKQYIAEAFSKEYGYRVKIASDCGSDHMDIIEKCLAKYNLVSATPFKRTPIEENPMEFYRAKGVQFTSEVCSSDVVLKYPVNERILEVWLAVNLGLDHERVLCYGVKEPRRLEADIQAERMANNEDRVVDIDPENMDLKDGDDAFEHYEMENQDEQSEKLVDKNKVLRVKTYKDSKEKYEKNEVIFGKYRIYTHRPGGIKIRDISNNKQYKPIENQRQPTKAV